MGVDPIENEASNPCCSLRRTILSAKAMRVRNQMVAHEPQLNEQHEGEDTLFAGTGLQYL